MADALALAGWGRDTVALAGASTKRLMAGPVQPSDIRISTTGLERVLQYEPCDLTISVEAGLRWRQFTRLLAANRQMVPLDPPFAETATVGGVVAANCSGPRRRLYGTARDFVIGMRFATMEGKLVETGGMVVKNVAGLDMAKLMIGSFGTLAAIVSVNFKVAPMPEGARSFVLPCDSLGAALGARDRILRSTLQPAALDLVGPAAAADAGLDGASWTLAVEAGGNAPTLARWERELAALGAQPLEGRAEAALWRGMREFAPRSMAAAPDGAVVRVSSTLTEMGGVLDAAPPKSIARAGSGVTYAAFEDAGAAARWASKALEHGCRAVVEFAPCARKAELELWPSPGPTLIS
jgi:glycolate oxidase FAD binding subunit